MKLKRIDNKEYLVIRNRQNIREKRRRGLLRTFIVMGLGILGCFGSLYLNNVTNGVPPDKYLVDEVTGKNDMREAYEKSLQKVIEERDRLHSEIITKKESERVAKMQKEAVIKSLDITFRGVLKNRGRFIYAVCTGEKVNPLLFGAITILESTNGTSELIVKGNNPGGLNWTEECGFPKYDKWYIKYPSLERGLQEMTICLKDFYIDEGKTTIPKIGIKYAPPTDYRNGIGGMDNTEWVKNVTTIYNDLLNKVENNKVK